MSARAHLEQVEESTGRRPKELIGPPFPDIARYVWERFIEIHRGRSRTGMGHTCLTWLDIQSWCNLFHVRLSSWEIEVIVDLSDTWARIMNEDVNG